MAARRKMAVPALEKKPGRPQPKTEDDTLVYISIRVPLSQRDALKRISLKRRQSLQVITQSLLADLIENEG